MMTELQKATFTEIFKATKAAHQQNRDTLKEWWTARELREFILGHEKANILTDQMLESIARVVEWEQGIRFDLGEAV